MIKLLNHPITKKYYSFSVLLFLSFSAFMFLSFSFSMFFSQPIHAIYDPLSVPNNRYGIHILEPSELEKAAELVNSNGGEWGYVTVPIRATDRDIDKWTKFFKQTKQHKVIPILRVATYGRGETWVLPTEEELLYFANFLEQLPWPVLNRYLLIFNEINHSREWGGYVDPEAYADLLSYTIKIFKEKNSDYFIMPAGLDHAAPDNHTSINAFTYWNRVFEHNPDLVNQIDGWNVHAYPNPGFVGKPADRSDKSIVSYEKEIQMIKDMGREHIPIFITETGWDQERLSEDTVKNYWQTAYQDIWTEEEIVAITPFLLHSNGGAFDKFTFLQANETPTAAYQAMAEIEKIKGEPYINQAEEYLKKAPIDIPKANTAKEKNWNLPQFDLDLSGLFDSIKQMWADWFSDEQYMTIGDKLIYIEVADEPQEITLGLGHRQSMPEDNGMLFVFPKMTQPSFWMKNTLFPLDIIWIRNHKVIDITKDIPVEADPNRPQKFYRPNGSVNYVLEVNAGFADKYGIEVGDEVEISY